MYKPSPNSADFDESKGIIGGRITALLHFAVLFGTPWNNLLYFSVPCHEEITIHIILMRKELKGVSTGELLVHTVHAVLIQFGYNSVDCL